MKEFTFSNTRSEVEILTKAKYIWIVQKQQLCPCYWKSFFVLITTLLHWRMPNSITVSICVPVDETYWFSMNWNGWWMDCTVILRKNVMKFACSWRIKMCPRVDFRNRMKGRSVETFDDECGWSESYIIWRHSSKKDENFISCEQKPKKN